MAARLIAILERDAEFFRVRQMEREASLLDYYVAAGRGLLRELENELLTAREAEQELGLNEKRLYRARKSGDLSPSGKKGNALLYRRGDLRRLVQHQAPVVPIRSTRVER